MRTIATLVCAGCLLTGPVLAQSPVTVVINTQSPGYRIADDFAGLSFETGSQRYGRNGVPGYLFYAGNTQLATLFKQMGLHHLRVGGGTVDGTNAVLLDNTAIDNLFNFAGAAKVKIIYSLQLENGDTNTDAAVAQYIWANHQAQLQCFSIGNEPDFYSTDPLITDYPSYLADWRNFALAVTNAVPAATFAGPDTGSYSTSTYYNGQSWTEHFANDEMNSGYIRYITQHFYVGGSPGSLTAQDGINNMLSSGWVTSSYPWLYYNNILPVVVDGLPYRLTESNDYLVGIPNASNAFASALWALDYMYWWASHGCAGVNFHNKPWLTTDTVYYDSTSGSYQINPKAYGIKAFDLGSHGYVDPVTLTNPDSLNLTAYGVAGTNYTYVTIINKEHGNGARDAAVTLMPAGISSGTVEEMILTDGKSGDASLTNNITLGGSFITNSAPWDGQWTVLDPLTNGQCTLTVTAASAAVVRILPASFYSPPAIVRDLPPQVPVAAGKSYRLSVSATGASPLSYQWYAGTALIPGETNADYLAAAGGVGDSTQFQVVITNVYGAVTSAVSTVTVIQPLTDFYSYRVQGPGPVGYWPLQEATEPGPANVETNYGTLGAAGDACYAAVSPTDVTFSQPGALTASGDSDSCVGFNGAGASGTPSSYAFVPRVSPELTLRPPFSLEAWVKSSSTQFADILGEGGSGLNSPPNNGNFGGIRMSWGGNNGGGPDLQAYVYTGVAGNYTALKGPGGSAAYGVWHHCVITYDSTAAVTLYGDGQLQGTAVVPMNIDTWTPFTIGAGRWQGFMPTRALPGFVDEVAVYTNVLSATDVNNHYLAGITPGSNYVEAVQSNHPLLYYRMDRPGYIAPNPAFYPVAVNYGSAPVNGAYLPGTLPGDLSGPSIPALGTNTFALPDNGINSCVDAGNDPAFNPTGTQPFTAMIWFRSYPSDGRVQALMSHGSVASWALNLNGTDGTLVWSSGAGSVVSTNILNDGNWHQAVGVYDGSRNILYVDGVLNNLALASGGVVGNTNDDLFLGGDPDYTVVGVNQRYFAGAIAHAAFYTNALTAAQVQSIYQAGLIVPPPETLTLGHAGVNQLELNWNYGTLQRATNVAGPYSDILGAFPPWTIALTNSQQFYRLREN